MEATSAICDSISFSQTDIHAKMMQNKNTNDVSMSLLWVRCDLAASGKNDTLSMKVIRHNIVIVNAISIVLWPISRLQLYCIAVKTPAKASTAVTIHLACFSQWVDRTLSLPICAIATPKLSVSTM